LVLLGTADDQSKQSLAELSRAELLVELVLFFLWQIRLRFVSKSPADPASESKPSNLLSPFYVPRDEQFGQIKEDDFLASGARSVTHSAGPTLRTAETHDPNFSSLDQIFQLYTSKGTDKGVMKNLQPVTTRTVGDPLEFFHEFILPQGEDTNLLKYPLPNILAGEREIQVPISFHL
jgi:hypothetical protein